MIDLRWIGAVLLLTGISWSAEPVADRDLRESAERILSESAFQSFDRFPKGVQAPEPAASPSPSQSSSDTETSSKSGEGGDRSSAPENSSGQWWDRLRQKKSKSKSDSSSSDESRGTSQGDQPSSTPSTSPEHRPSTSEPDAAQPAETAPQREAGTRKSPALRGSDGVTRPVRFAPKVRQPEPPRGPDWNLDLGWMSGLGVVLGSILHVLAYAVVIGVCVLIVLLVVKAVQEFRGQRQTGPATTLSAATPLAHDRSPGETEADQFLREALRLAEQGEYRAALGQLVLGAMSTIERRQWIRYRRGLTLNDYMRSVRSRPEQWTGLRFVINTYEPVEFGRRAATPEQFSVALAGYRQAFSAPDVSQPGQGG